MEFDKKQEIKINLVSGNNPTYIEITTDNIWVCGNSLESAIKAFDIALKEHEKGEK